MSTWFKVAAVLAEHKIVADIEGAATEKSASIVRMSPASTGLLSCHVTGEFGFVQVVRANQFKDGEVFVFWKGLEGVHCSLSQTIGEDKISSSSVG